MLEVIRFLQRADALADPGTQRALEALARGLRIAGPAAAGRDHAMERTPWSSAGFAAVGEVALPELCARLVAATGSLTAAGLPAMFLYCFDEAWHLGDVLAARVSASLGRKYVVAEDVWAWRIAPGAGRGWPPHRGLFSPLLERGAPELVNTWVALSDVEVERACMHFVPLDADPAYPTALDSLEVPVAAVRAVPLRAGDALAWNANILHWGGVCAPQAKGARVSCSFSLVREDASAALGVPLAGKAATDLRARLDAVARQLLVYGNGQPDVRPEVLAWARGNAAIAALSRRLPSP